MTDPNAEVKARREDELIVRALREEGVDVTSVFDLVNDRASHPEAVPVLLRVLPQVTDAWMKQGIVRALTDPAAKGVAARPLIEELEAARDAGQMSLAWAIGNALTVVATDAVLDDLLRLAL